MFFWILAIVMVAAAVVCILVPLSRRHTPVSGDSRASFYEAQLKELELGGEQASDSKRLEERAEIGRRLLAAKKETSDDQVFGQGSRRSVVAVSLVALLFVPGFTAAVYGMLGAPGFEADRKSAQSLPIEQQSVEQLVDTAERQLAKNPDDLRGWTVLAAVYGRTGQFAKRAQALSNMVRLSNATPELLAELAESRTLANDGIVSEETVSLLKQTLGSDPENIKAKAYLILAVEQEGRLGEALASWRELLSKTKGEQVWVERISQRIARLEGLTASSPQKGPNQEQVEEASRLPADEQKSMIITMVSGLAQRLQDEPDDIEGWLRLLRSYHVLGEAGGLVEAWETSAKVFAGRKPETARLMAVVQELGYSLDEDGNLKGGLIQ